MIGTRYRIPTVSPGALLRKERRLGSALGQEAERFTSQGQLAPDDVVNDVVKSWLRKHGVAFIFDGYPRSLGQRSALNRMLAERMTPLDVAFLLEADSQTIRVRINQRRICLGCGRIVSLDLHIEHASSSCPSCGGKLAKREDDTVETLKLRMREYGTKTEPLIEYYRGRGLLYLVDAVQASEVVFCSIAKILETQ